MGFFPTQTHSTGENVSGRKQFHFGESIKQLWHPVFSAMEHASALSPPALFYLSFRLMVSARF
jgi:hypothetical protein